MPFDSSDPRARELVEWLRDYARRRLNTTLSDDRRCIPPNVILDLGRKGILGLTSDPDDGGAGLSMGAAMRVIWQLSAIDLALGNLVGMHNLLGGRVILTHGAPSALEEFKLDLVSGRSLAAFALTESCAGSDPRRIQTRATQLADGSWQLDGEKIWCGLAAWSRVAAVFARAESMEGEDLGITGFVVPMDSQGVSQGAEAVTMGLRAVPQNSLKFEDVRLGADSVLGRIGAGLAVAQSVMMLGRFVMTIFANAASVRSLQCAGRYICERRISTGLMAENPVVLDLYCREAARSQSVGLFLEHGFKNLDLGRPLPELFCLTSKAVGPEESWKSIDLAMQLMGGRGYLEPNVVSRMARDARILRIFEGPTEAMVAYLGSYVCTRQGELEQYLSEGLASPDLWQAISHAVERGSPKEPANKRLSRADLLRAQYHAGRIASRAIFAAVVRMESSRDETDDLALRSALDELQSALKEREKEPSWCDCECLQPLLNRIDHIAGCIDESKGGEDWKTDSFLLAKP